MTDDHGSHMPDPFGDGPRAEVGRYRRLAAARERGLVFSALGLPHWIEREGEEWVLLVEEPASERARRELAEFEAEQKARPPERALWPAARVPKFSLYAAAWILCGFFFAQETLPQPWTERGVADGAAILAGEWWRAITALTLHGDGAHLAANLATGLLFAAFLIPRLGTGGTWLAILFSGALGNALNAWGYRGQPHFSIGASTACFGALGLLVGWELWARWREPETRHGWQLILPLGAGLALLAFLGVGEEGRHVDYMAHCWGLIAGCALGLLAQALRVKERTGSRTQRLAAAGALAILAAAWLRALSALWMG